jgi:hypothetical protein
MDHAEYIRKRYAHRPPEIASPDEDAARVPAACAEQVQWGIDYIRRVCGRRPAWPGEA